jgi:CubicO group peptidase (beta-lactamase class C family)
MRDLEETVGRIAAETGFSGVVRVDRDGEVQLEMAYGLAHRGLGVPNTVETRFGLASGVKGMTALVVVSLLEEGLLELSTTARSVLGEDLPLIDDEVTIEHLLTHRSGIGDYFDEDVDRPITDHVLAVPVHELETTERYVKVLDGFPSKFRPGERFSYCNGGYVVLALIAERSSGTSFHELVERRVCDPAGMRNTAFLRSDELPGIAAIGYLDAEGLRSNVLHLPVRGTGDGGIYSTAADVHSLWEALFAGRVVSPSWVAEMVRPRSEGLSEERSYGMGFWLQESRDAVMLEGYDAGASFRTVHDRSVTHTVLSNTTEGAWSITYRLDEILLP